MPVGTAATVKAMTVEMVQATGAQIILGNTYHLMLRPGAERIARLGGLHRFMRWPGPILTDSGGFQVMSLAKIRKLDEAGVVFASHIDGSRHTLTPERSIEIQHLLGADITMQLDECLRAAGRAAEVERAMAAVAALGRALEGGVHGRGPGHGLFGIVQGGTDAALRRASAEGLPGDRLRRLCAWAGSPSASRRRSCSRRWMRSRRVLPGRPAALPDGRRQARRHRGCGRPRHRHVRLRAADPLGPHRPGLHLARCRQPQERAPCR